MCLAIPAKIVKLYDENKALIDVGGIEREISVALLDEVSIGDFVIVHVGYALSLLDEEDAKETLALFEEISKLNEKEV